MVIEVGDEVTNGHWAVRCRDETKSEKLSMTVLALDGPDAWLFVNNGMNQGHRLTFSIRNLERIK